MRVGSEVHFVGIGGGGGVVVVVDGRCSSGGGGCRDGSGRWDCLSPDVRCDKLIGDLK